MCRQRGHEHQHVLQPLVRAEEPRQRANEGPPRANHGVGPAAEPGIGGFYYVMAGEGIATVGQETAPIRTGAAVPIRVGEVKGFENTGTAPLEFLVVGIARDMNKKNDMLATPPQRMGGPGGRGR